MATLLDKAREAPTNRKNDRNRCSEEELELLLASARGEITFRQISVATGRNNVASAQSYVYSLAFRAVRSGQLIVKP